MKKYLCLILALIPLLSLSGCAGLSIFSNYRQLENIELVRAVSLDLSDGGVNAAIYGTAGEESPARMYENPGPSVGVALGELILTPLGREAILSHTESVLIGQDLAKTGLRECLDYVERFSETRLDTDILIVRDGSARDLLAGLSGDETSSADVLSGLGKNISRLGEGYFFTCREIASSLAENGCALIQCVRGVKEEKLFDARGELDLESAGFAVARDGVVTDFLSDEETLGAMLLLGKYRSGNLDLPLGDQTVTVSMDLVGTDIAPRFDRDGALTALDITFDFRANVINLSGPVEITDSSVRRTCEEELTKIMTGAATAAVEKSRALGTDFLDLEGAVERRAPIKFRDMGADWQDVFLTLPVRIKGTSVLARTYDIADPPELSGKEDKSPWEKLTELLKDS